MKNFVKKKFFKYMTGAGMGVGLILFGPNLMQPKSLLSETYSSYINQQQNRYNDLPRMSFMGSVCRGDYDSNPDLDFVIKTQEKPGQNYLVDDITNQHYRYILVHRNFKEKNKKLANIIKKIRKEINILNKRDQNKVIVYGRYSTESELIKEKFDGFLELTSIWIYDSKGNRKILTIEDIYGGVR